MVNLLFDTPVKTAGDERARKVTSLAYPSILRPPLPPPISAVGRFPISWNDNAFISRSLCKELSQSARQALGKWCEAEYIEVGNDVMCSLETGDDVHVCQVGKTMDRIAMRHGDDVARSIFDLLDKSPVHICTPRDQIEMCEMWAGWNDHDEPVIPYPQKSIGSLYPRWAYGGKDWFARERKRPKVRPIPSDLRELMDVCDDADPKYEWPDTDGEDIARFPYAVICWEQGYWAPDWTTVSFTPEYNLPANTGKDPSWIHLFPSYRNGQEVGATIFSPCAPQHSENDLMQLLQSAKPYMKLLDYITDEQN